MTESKQTVLVVTINQLRSAKGTKGKPDLVLRLTLESESHRFAVPLKDRERVAINELLFMNVHDVYRAKLNFTLIDPTHGGIQSQALHKEVASGEVLSEGSINIRELERKEGITIALDMAGVVTCTLELSLLLDERVEALQKTYRSKSRSLLDLNMDLIDKSINEDLASARNLQEILDTARSRDTTLLQLSDSDNEDTPSSKQSKHKHKSGKHKSKEK
eukprot:c6012_g1_i2.p1 GENE.c6012_g1_i2~~c6012_g1_i2.p1  ORF type:complete len:236 (+),score=58.27 c6012_g1_i2:57-710(+)